MDPHRYLPRELVALVVRAYEEAYESSQRDINAVEGDDGFVFGVMVWRRAVARLSYYAEQYGVRYVRRNNHIELQLPEGTLRPYPGGKNPIDETAKLPFRADSRAKEELLADNTEQLSLFVEYPRVRLVLLHVGDVQTGLRELWVGAPFLDKDEELIGWQGLQRIYSSEDSAKEAFEEPLALHRFPPFTQREAAEIDMGPKEQVETERQQRDSE